MTAALLSFIDASGSHSRYVTPHISAAYAYTGWMWGWAEAARLNETTSHTSGPRIGIACARRGVSGAGTRRTTAGGRPQPLQRIRLTAS